MKNINSFFRTQLSGKELFFKSKLAKNNTTNLIKKRKHRLFNLHKCKGEKKKFLIIIFLILNFKIFFFFFFCSPKENHMQIQIKLITKQCLLIKNHRWCSN